MKKSIKRSILFIDNHTIYYNQMKTPFQIHRERKERKKLEKMIRDESIKFGEDLNEHSRKKLIYLYELYSVKYGREYLGR